VADRRVDRFHRDRCRRVRLARGVRPGAGPVRGTVSDRELYGLQSGARLESDRRRSDVSLDSERERRLRSGPRTAPESISSKSAPVGPTLFRTGASRIPNSGPISRGSFVQSGPRRSTRHSQTRRRILAGSSFSPSSRRRPAEGSNRRSRWRKSNRKNSQSIRRRRRTLGTGISATRLASIDAGDETPFATTTIPEAQIPAVEGQFDFAVVQKDNAGNESDPASFPGWAAVPLDLSPPPPATGGQIVPV
jgi:hypothetical protein